MTKINTNVDAFMTEVLAYPLEYQIAILRTTIRYFPEITTSTIFIDWCMKKHEDHVQSTSYGG